ncbi:cysteine hydrolase family protein [Rhodococcus sp. NPDC059968]|uniref:cysteine hydrolase family protein n=1 Tax=Rhodococcus sp. NPDC059968 TaxID=3347017 RepID=UPI00366D4A68
MKRILGKDVCETLEEVLNPDWCAVVPIDLQNDFMHPNGKVAQAGTDISAMEALRIGSADFLSQTRDLGVKIIHVRMVDLPDGQSDSPSWIRSKRHIANVSDCSVEGTWGAEFVEGCEALPGEPVVTKHRSSAFTRTNLDLILRANGIQTVVIIGEQTPGCVEATYRDAAYHDYYNVLVEDRVAAQNAELHAASIKIQRARHDVATADEILRIWRKHRG